MSAPFSFHASSRLQFVKSARFARNARGGPGWRIVGVKSTLVDDPGPSFPNLAVDETSEDFKVPPAGKESSYFSQYYQDSTLTKQSNTPNFYDTSEVDATTWNDGFFGSTAHFISCDYWKQGDHGLNHWGDYFERMMITGPAKGVFVNYTIDITVSGPLPFFADQTGFAYNSVEQVSLDTGENLIRTPVGGAAFTQAAMVFWIGKTAADFP